MILERKKSQEGFGRSPGAVEEGVFKKAGAMGVRRDSERERGAMCGVEVAWSGSFGCAENARCRVAAGFRTEMRGFRSDGVWSVTLQGDG